MIMETVGNKIGLKNQLDPRLPVCAIVARWRAKKVLEKKGEVEHLEQLQKARCTVAAILSIFRGRRKFTTTTWPSSSKPSPILCYFCQGWEAGNPPSPWRGGANGEIDFNWPTWSTFMNVKKPYAWFRTQFLSPPLSSQARYLFILSQLPL